MSLYLFTSELRNRVEREWDTLSFGNCISCLWTWSLLLASEQGQEGNIGDLDNLETNAGNVTDGVTGTTETSDQDLIVLLDIIQTTVIGNKGGDLFAIFDQLEIRVREFIHGI